MIDFVGDFFSVFFFVHLFTLCIGSDKYIDSTMSSGMVVRQRCSSVSARTIGVGEFGS